MKTGLIKNLQNILKKNKIMQEDVLIKYINRLKTAELVYKEGIISDSGFIKLDEAILILKEYNTEFTRKILENA